MARCLGCGSVDDAVRNGEPFCDACPIEVKRAVVLREAKQKAKEAEARDIIRGLLVVSALGALALAFIFGSALWAP